MKYYQLAFLLLVSLSFLTASNGLRKKRLSPPAPCPDGSSPVRCFVNPCQTSSCNVEGATCRANYCGGCRAIWYKDNKKVDCHTRPITEAPPPKASPSPLVNGRCPGGFRPVNCLVDPCQTSRCSIEGAECRTDYCKGCSAEWFLNNKKITCPSGPRTETPSPTSAVQPPAPLVNGRCPGGFRPVNCFVDPCQISRCSIAGAECRTDYCKGCGAEWFLNGQKVNCDGNAAPEEEDTPHEEEEEVQPAEVEQGGEEEAEERPKCEEGIANCFVDPCIASRCDVEGAECRSNYCGGCFADWFLNNKKIDCTPKASPSPCANPVRCLVNPCQFARCGVAGAKCIPNFCGGCNAEWFLNNEKVEC